MAHPIVNFLAGPTYPLRALRLFLAQPTLRRYMLVPIAINIVLTIGLYLGLLLPGLDGIDRFTQALEALLQSWEGVAPTTLGPLTWGPFHLGLGQWAVDLGPWHLGPWNLAGFNLDFLSDLAGWIGGLLRVLLTLGLFLGSGFLFAQFGTLLGAPWYGKLSETIERHQTGQLQSIEVGLLGDVGRALSYELKKLLILVLAGIGLLVLNVIPAAGTAVSTILGLGTASLLVGLDFLDSPMERRRLRFRTKLSWVLRPGTMPFALTCLALVSVPLLNLVTVPICVASGTLFFCDRIWPNLPGATESTHKP